MASSMKSSSALTRYSSLDLTRPHQQPVSASPSPLRSNSFVASRRSGIVSEQDALRLASAVEDDRPDTVDPRQQPCTRTTSVPSQWPAPVLRQMSGERRPRPLSTGYLPSNTADSQSNQQHVYGQAPQTAVKTDGLDPQLRLQNVALLPNRQLIQQPADSRWRQWNGSTPQRKGRPFGDVLPSTTPSNNGWARSSNHAHDPPRSDEHHHQQQLLAEREAELRAIRSTMEQNEAAILRAMDDQRRAWELDVASERESWELRLRDAERQTDNVKQTLMSRVHELERQNAALQQQKSNIDYAHSAAHHQRRTAANHDEELRAQRTSGDEMSVVSRGSFKQLSTVNGVDRRPLAARYFTPPAGSNASTSHRTEQRRAPATELNGEETDSALLSPPAAVSPDGPTAATRRQCQHCEALSSQLERVRQEFDAERQQWLTEKRRVITYQKLLQSKYIQLQQRCAELEGGSTDKLNHVETVNGITASGLEVHGAGWQTSHRAQSSSSPSSLFPPRLIPFGQSVET